MKTIETESQWLRLGFRVLLLLVITAVAAYNYGYSIAQMAYQQECHGP